VTYKNVTERFANVSCVESARRLNRVLSQHSQLVRVAGKLPESIPAERKDVASSGGADSANLSNKDDYLGSKSAKIGLYALEKADLFTLLCIPPDTRGDHTPKEVYQEAWSTV